MKVGFTNGVFDIIHPGHIDGFRAMKQYCDRLIVGINSDKSTERLNKSFIQRPINPLQDRIEVLSAINYVDIIISFDEDTPLELIKLIKPDVLFKGEDYNKPGHPIGKEYAKEVVFIGLSDHSTTEIIKRILWGATK